jgi:glycosyltransferase involved in cell wall biosynthesis
MHMSAAPPPVTHRPSDAEVSDPGTVALSYVVPAHNSTPVIAATLRQLAGRLRHTDAEILVVENGSTDGTGELLEDLRLAWSFDRPQLRVLTSEKGLGNALRAGVVASRGDVIVFGADDLPFGFDELDAAAGLDVAGAKVVIGSKAHPVSAVDRSPTRFVLSRGFRLLRRVACGMRTGDPQGTFVLDGAWARSVVGALREPGFLLTTELVYLAELQGIRPVEVPVRLREDHAAHGTRVRLADIRKMMLGTLALRRRKAGLSAVPPQSPAGSVTSLVNSAGRS